jgi:hypothetical protein
MRYLALSVSIALLVFSCVVSAEAKDVSFAGSWTLNSEKSDLGESRMRGFSPTELSVTQNGGKLVVESTRRGRNGQDMTTEMTYTLDGKECSNDSEYRKSTSTAKWSDDGKMLTISTKSTFSRNGNEFTFETVEIWTMDGGSLTIDSTMNSRRGERKTRLVYDKA